MIVRDILPESIIRRTTRFFGVFTSGGGGSPPNVPTLAVSDNADGTGGVATVTGSTNGAVNTLYSAVWSGGTGALTWATGSSRTSDGTITTALQGFYVWQVRSVLNQFESVSNLVYQNLTNANLHTPPPRILDAVAVKIRALGLSGLSSVNVVTKWLPRFLDKVDTMPAVMVCPGTKENYPGILNTKDDIGEPVMICIFDEQAQDYTANLARNRDWRWLIRSAFRYQTLPGVPEVIQCYPEETDIFDKAAWEANTFMSVVLMRFMTRTIRG